ncbi:MAG: hypothetical protein RMJ97_12380, partial [Raineya sp.]|nr:hypothetical protein [Raineya sp.]
VFEGHELLPELQAKFGQTTVKLIKAFVEKYPNIQGKKQIGKPTYYPKRTPKDSELDINKTINEQFNLLRVCDNEQYPAFFVKDGIKYILKIEKSQ